MLQARIASIRKNAVSGQDALTLLEPVEYRWDKPPPADRADQMMALMNTIRF
jgi:hypothetical protein